MASSDNFREQLKAGNITEALALALSKTTALKITTWVASGTDEVETGTGKPSDRLRTSINAIEGKFENEIGEQFIGNGRYRELRQFHFDQVAQSSKIIQSNLKSLQKLFEVLVALHYPTEAPAVIKPESASVESQLLPPNEEVADAGLVIEPHESVVTPNALTQENIAQASLLPSEAPSSFVTTPADSREALDSQAEEAEEEEEEDDWDNSVLDLLESLPVAPPPNREDLDSEFEEDWRNFIVEEPQPHPTAPDSERGRDWGTLSLEDLESPPVSRELDLDGLNYPIQEDLGKLVADEPEPDPELEVRGERDWGTLTREDLEPPPVSPPNAEVSKIQTDEDGGKLVAEEPESHPAVSDLANDRDRQTPARQDFESPLASPEPNSEASNSPLNQDWGWEDLAIEEPRPHPTASDLESHRHWETPAGEDFESPPVSPTLNSQLDEDWGDMVEPEPDPDPKKPVPSMESLDLEEDDDEWDDWVVEEPEPLVDAPIADIEPLEPREDDEWDDFEEESDPFAPATAFGESASTLEIDEDWDEFAVEELEPYSTSPDDINVETGFDPSASTKPRETKLDSATPDDNGVDSREESRSTQIPFEDYAADDREPGLGSPTSANPKAPPPPPPRRFPNQNNEK